MGRVAGRCELGAAPVVWAGGVAVEQVCTRAVPVLLYAGVSDVRSDVLPHAVRGTDLAAPAVGVVRHQNR